jgi:hypothetical protein
MAPLRRRRPDVISRRSRNQRIETIPRATPIFSIHGARFSREITGVSLTVSNGTLKTRQLGAFGAPTPVIVSRSNSGHIRIVVFTIFQSRAAQQRENKATADGQKPNHFGMARSKQESGGGNET